MDTEQFKNKLTVTIKMNEQEHATWTLYNNDDTGLLLRMVTDDVQGFFLMLELAVYATQKDYMQFILDRGTYMGKEK